MPLLENVQLSGNAFVGQLPDLTGVTRLTHLNVAGNCTWNRLRDVVITKQIIS